MLVFRLYFTNEYPKKPQTLNKNRKKRRYFKNIFPSVLSQEEIGRSVQLQCILSNWWRTFFLAITFNVYISVDNNIWASGWVIISSAVCIRNNAQIHVVNSIVLALFVTFCIIAKMYLNKYVLFCFFSKVILEWLYLSMCREIN